MREAVPLRGASPSLTRLTRRGAAGSSASWADGPMCISLLIFVIAFGWAIAHPSQDIWVALVTGPLLAAATVRLVAVRAHHQGDPQMARLLFYAVLVKLCGGVARYALTFSLYDVSDADRYHTNGAALATAFRNGNFDLGQGRLVGTRFIEILTGAVYTVIGPNQISGFLVFSWLGFWGLYFFYRAFRLAVPEGDHHRYACFLFFLPSLVFWPSSIGKEAWLVFTLGACSYGAARILTRRRGGFLVTAAGLWGVGVVRPHMALLVIGGLIIGFILHRGDHLSPKAILIRVVGIALILVALSISVHTFKDFFKVDQLDLESVAQVLDKTENQTAEGGSEFRPSGVRSPLDYPAAAVTVLFRPFPTEAPNGQGIAAALESVFIVGALLLSGDRLATLPRAVFRSPYVAYAVTFVLLFIYGFSVIANFGILARQRVQVLPLLLVVLGLPRAARRSEHRHEVASVDPRLDE